MKLTRRQAMWMSLAGGTGLSSLSVFAQAFPARPITVVVPFVAGGPTDAVTRTINVPLGRSLKQSIVVENVAGAGGIIGAQNVLRAPADGYRIYRGSLSELVLGPLLTPSVSFRAEDFRLVQGNTSVEIALLARRGLPVNSVAELLDLAGRQAKNGKPLTYASIGSGSFYHLLGSYFSKSIGQEMTHVPYKGAAPAEQALLADEVDIMFGALLGKHAEFEKSGKLKLLAVLSDQRLEDWPAYPSITEVSTLKKFVYNLWGGYFVRKDTPDSITNILCRAIGEATLSPEVAPSLKALNQKVSQPLTIASADHLFRTGIQQYRELARISGFVSERV